jgi:hypothetical protein
LKTQNKVVEALDEHIVRTPGHRMVSPAVSLSVIARSWPICASKDRIP